ncbi:MAG TPA: peptidylprolyl isomerase [Myxococcota bacterium]|nr:peptidylprolyl isomerase [Myxococcota bacterium]
MQTLCRMAVVAAVMGSATPTLAAREMVDRIVAVIDDEVITWRELEAKADGYYGQLAEMSDPQAREAKRQQILKQVLDIEIGDRIVEREITQNKERLGVGEKDIDRAVEEVLRMNHLTREQLQSALYGQGLTWGEYRDKLRIQIERARLIQFKVQGKVQLKDSEVLRRCEERKRSGSHNLEVCASHVLLAIPRGASDADIEALHAEASKLQSELQSGADFAAYALKYSADKAAPDGKLGCFHKGEMVEPFERAAFALPVGGVSAVVRTEFGFHIIKVSDRRTASTGTCDGDALEPFRNELYQEEMGRQMATWVEDLRKKAFVDVRL